MLSTFYLAIPALVIKDNEHLRDTLKSILIESSTEAVGSSRMAKLNTEQLIIELARHLIAKGPLIEK